MSSFSGLLSLGRLVTQFQNIHRIWRESLSEFGSWDYKCHAQLDFPPSRCVMLLVAFSVLPKMVVKMTCDTCLATPLTSITSSWSGRGFFDDIGEEQ